MFVTSTTESDFYMENSSIDHNVTLIIMFSCSTGKEKGFAQRMSEELNIVIVAPSDNIEIGRETAKYLGIKNNGTWNVFYRGVKVDSFDGTIEPIFEDPEQAIERYKTKYKQLYENQE